MKLERIIMSGFKSFANKTTIELTDGVTAIVGPNGSGKSNLAEAIKWVLGEQSAKSLRGKRMDDLIFSGSDSKKAVNFCEVSLVFNNEDRYLGVDANEVVITRRYHRTGDSQVYINQQAVRLKDVTLLLMDSGMGKDSFSMISQGKVEEIFNNRPEQRREIIEEVAGVLTYKNQKAEAERKLEKTEDHLSRLKDILFEISGQLGPLEQQSQKASQYVELEADLSDLSIRLLASELKRIKQESEALSEDQRKRQGTYQTICQEHGIKENALHQASQQLEMGRKQLNALKQSYVEFVEAKTKQAGEYELLNERLKHAELSGADQRQQLAKVKERLRLLLDEKETLAQAKTRQEQKTKAIGETIRTLQEELKRYSQGPEVELEQLKNAYFDLLQKKARLEQATHQYEAGQDQRQALFDRKAQEVKNIEGHLAQLRDKQVASQQALEEQKEELKALTTKIQQEVQAVERQKQAYQEAQSACQQAERQLSGLKARYESLEALAKDHAGYYGGVKYLLQHKQAIPGLIGAIAELIRLKPEHELAISTALGASAQHLVTDTEEAAKEGIRRLKRDGRGRATFLPLTNLKERSLSHSQIQSAKALDGFVGVASDLVMCEDRVRLAVSQSLGTVVVARDLEAASLISKTLHRKVRVVTLKGDVFNAGGSLSGGQEQTKGASLISRQSELDQLKRSVAQLEEKTKGLYQLQTEALQQLEAAQDKGKQKRDRYQELKVALSRLTADLDYQTETLAEQEKEWQVRQYEWQIAKEDEASDKTLYQEQKQELQDVLEKIAHNQKRMTALTVSDEERQEKIKSLEESLQTQQTQYAVMQEQVKHLKAQVADKSDSLKQERQLEEELLQGESLSKEEETQLKERQKTLKDALAKREEEHLIYQKELDQKEADLTQVEGEVASLTKIERQLYQEMEKIQLAIAEKEKEEAKYDLQMDQMLTELTEDFRMSYEKASAYGELTLPLAEAKRKVKSLRAKIQQLGPINMASIEEYQLTKTRYDDLSQQKKDVEEAKADLETTMKELDQEVRDRFKETFYQVKEAFETTFPRLFGGGRASLELTDPADYLTTGVDIIAQPPGKKLQALSLLSGGERALTAIALLFSILQVKPVPFCLLDEVEAALDDANVSRYGHYLKHFTPATQFMVITHRKGTMEEADVLYGVTMQDSGVSAIASVKLEEVNEADLTA